MTHEWSGISYQEAVAGGHAPYILLLAVGFIYLFLAALYGSWMLPFAVLPAIIPALGGALWFLEFSGFSNNIYTGIGIILLFGMACKTSILVVDFAQISHKQNKLQIPEKSASNAAKLRFRAVLMTSCAFIFGTLPLMFGSGPGAASQRSIGYPVVGGMLGTLLAGLLFCPVFFAVIRRILNRISPEKTL